MQLFYGACTPIAVPPIQAIKGLKSACATGKTEIPAIVREMDDDEATLIMVDSNLQRETLLLSEKAFAYKMKIEALDRRAGRPPNANLGQIVPNSFGKRSTEIIGEQTGESYKQIQRFIRLTSLQPELMDMVDRKEMAFNSAVFLIYTMGFCSR